MAKATLQEVKPVRPNVLLELTPAEAEALVIVTGMVGGNPASSARGKIDDIREALNSVGYDSPYPNTAATGSIFFKNE